MHQGGDRPPAKEVIGRPPQRRVFILASLSACARRPITAEMLSVMIWVKFSLVGSSMLIMIKFSLVSLVVSLGMHDKAG